MYIFFATKHAKHSSTELDNYVNKNNEYFSLMHMQLSFAKGV